MMRAARLKRGSAGATALCGPSRVALMRCAWRRFATDANADAAGAGAAAAAKPANANKKPVDPFTSTQPLTRLVRVPTLSGDFNVTNHTHTKVRVRDRRALAWAAHRFDENGNRKWAADTLARRARVPEPWSVSKDQLLYLRLYGNPRVPKSMRPAHPRNVIREVEKEYITKLNRQNKLNTAAGMDSVDAKDTAAVAKAADALPSHIEPFKAGDKIRITKYISMQKEKFEEIMGLVIARYGGQGNKRDALGRLNASFVIRNRVLGEAFEMTFPLYSPFIKKIEVVEKGTTRRTKLFYLREKDPDTYMT